MVHQSVRLPRFGALAEWAAVFARDPAAVLLPDPVRLFGPLADGLAFQLSEYLRHGEEGPAHRGCGVDWLGCAGQVRSGFAQLLDHAQGMQEPAGEAVELRDHEHGLGFAGLSDGAPEAGAVVVSPG